MAIVVLILPGYWSWEAMANLSGGRRGGKGLERQMNMGQKRRQRIGYREERRRDRWWMGVDGCSNDYVK